MKTVCLKCGYISNEYEGGNLYNNQKCDHEFVEIDDLMVESMIILNRKGYKTKFCCQGHAYEGINCGYVYFELPIFIDPKYSKPVNAYIDPVNPCIIRAEPDYPNLSDEELKYRANNPMDKLILMKSINDFNLSLLMWADNLPEFDYTKFITSEVFLNYVIKNKYPHHDKDLYEAISAGLKDYDKMHSYKRLFIINNLLDN